MPLPLLAVGGLAAAGGLGSLMSGMSGAGQANRNISAANQNIQGIKNRVPGQSAEVLGMLNQQYSPYTQNAGADMGAYRSAVGDIGGLEYAQADPFGYDLQAQSQQFLDPSMDYQIQQATDAVQGSAANRGNLFSSATGKAIADRSQEIARQSWKDAMNMALQDRGFQYGVYGDDINRDRANVDLQLQQQGQRVGALGNLAGMGQQATTNLANQTGNIKMGEYSALNEADMAMANNLMGRQDSSFGGNLGNLLTGGASALGGLLGGK